MGRLMLCLGGGGGLAWEGDEGGQLELTCVISEEAMGRRGWSEEQSAYYLRIIGGV